MRRFWSSSSSSSSADKSSSNKRAKSPPNKQQDDSVIVKYKKSTLVVHLGPLGEIQSGRATLGQLRRRVADSLGQTHPPRPDADKLILVMNGKKLLGSNDEPLKKLGVKRGLKMLCLVSKPPSSSQQLPPQSSPSKVQAQLPPNLKIASLLNKVHQDLDGRIEKFEAVANGGGESSSSTKINPQDEHRILSELVLQQLMNLDNIDTQDNPDARAKRKAAINELHQLHARIDAAYNKIIN